MKKNPKRVCAAPTRSSAQRGLLVSILLALVLACGCASLRPPDPAPRCEDPKPSSSDGSTSLNPSRAGVSV